MPLKKSTPKTPGQRFRIKNVVEGLYKGAPEASLVVPNKSSGGRNNHGNVTSRRRGGGHKRKYRIIDFKRNKFEIPGKVERLEYDPNRSAHIALICYRDGERRYVIAPQGVKPGDTIMSSENAEIKVGNCLPLAKIPMGSMIHNLELRPGKGGQIIRSAGNYGVLMAKEGSMAQIQLPSNEIRNIPAVCLATIGQVSNIDHMNTQLGKAGRNRWLGRRPKVRGVAMNPVDHPMGGGEGKSSGGRHPVSPWGQIAKGLKTRRPKASDKLILKRRSKKKRG